MLERALSTRQKHAGLVFRQQEVRKLRFGAAEENWCFGRLVWQLCVEGIKHEEKVGSESPVHCSL